MTEKESTEKSWTFKNGSKIKFIETDKEPFVGSKYPILFPNCAIKDPAEDITTA